VSSYHNHLPGAISRTWRNEHAAAEASETVRNSFKGKRTFGNILFACVVALSAGLAIAMQALGSLPYFYQRIIIRFVQPVFLSGLTVLWYLAVKNPIYVAVVVGATLFVVFVLYVRYKNRENNADRPGKIAPIQSPGVKMGLVVHHNSGNEGGNVQMSRQSLQGNGDSLHKPRSDSSLSSTSQVERVVPVHVAPFMPVVNEDSDVDSIGSSI